MVEQKISCPSCKETVELPKKKFGEPSKPCPLCGEVIYEWLISKEEYNVDFRVAGGTGAMRQGRKRFGGHKT